jgi:hypothetical protein
LQVFCALFSEQCAQAVKDFTMSSIFTPSGFALNLSLSQASAVFDTFGKCEIHCIFTVYSAELVAGQRAIEWAHASSI